MAKAAHPDIIAADVALDITKPDGQASIEHQIDIHVLDLTECRDSMADVLHGLKYCMDFRIKGGKLPSLDADLMERLLSALLPICSNQSGNLLSYRPTAEADLAFALFAQFMDEVMEFRMAVSKRSATDLRDALKIHRRCQPWSSEAQREVAADVLSLILHAFPKTLNWKELVKADEFDDVERLMQDFAGRFALDRSSRPTTPTAPSTMLFPPPALYFDRKTERLSEMFGVSFETGLSSERAELALKHYGPNVIPKPKAKSALRMIWTQLTDFMVLILIAASVTEIIMGDFRSAVVLLAVVLLNVVIGFTQERKASNALEALVTLTAPQASVLRDGVQQVIDSSLLVPGDIVVVDEGDAIPADLRLFQVSQLEVIESILTGESLPTSKSTESILKRTRRLPLGDCKGSAFMATTVARGRAKGIVVRTGIRTEIGKISLAISSAPTEPTNIEKKLQFLGKLLVVLSIFLCGVIVAIGIAYKNDVMEVLKVGISLAVSVIPEGLVAVVTVTNALGVRRMAAHNAIVRQLASVETLGSVSVICSDKTGTLTEGKMGCSSIWTADNSLFTFTNSTSPDPSQGNVQTRRSNCTLKEAMSGATLPLPSDIIVDVSRTFGEAPAHLLASAMISTLCNNAQIKQDNGEWVALGDPTEIAMVVAGQKSGFSREFFISNFGLERQQEFAFDSDRKLMSVVYCQTQADVAQSFKLPDNSALIFVKGAPEGVLSRCISYLPASANSNFTAMLTGSASPMTEEFVEFVSRQSASMAAKGLRILALALRNTSKDNVSEIVANPQSPSAAESDLTFVGLIGMIDPARSGVKDSVASCHKAGIRVVMITGDHIATAVAISEQLGIINKTIPNQSRSMSGYEVDSLSADALADLTPFPVVFARVSPDNKLKIVEALQNNGYSVAMTGDGVNDAPAIKRANVGIAMGIGGTEITKQAADIVLADDNFSSIVLAVREGRRVFDNIKKFCVYLLSCNSAEIFLFLAAAIKNDPMPFSTIQILWANIIADVPPAMSLGVELYERDIMERKPRPHDEGVVTMITSIVILLQGLLIATCPFVTYLLARANYLPGFENFQQHAVSKQQTLTFLVLTMMQILQCFFSRSVNLSVFRTGITGNRPMIAACLFSFLSLVCSIYIPGLSDWLEFQPMNYVGWFVVGIALIIQLVVVELLKFGLRWREARQFPESYEPVRRRQTK
uniref:P-type sodium-transporting ATPase4 n=1 Tax=Spongospora subterranea TaxID=70186 RepID=A0A0H5R9G6_9EUKA|eukprot:CRZ10426.1 hypothetical protein [Spongospora subterranea]